MLKFGQIIFAINTPGYNLAKFLIPILKPLTHNKFTVKDSFRFAKEITKYDSSLFMASLDVDLYLPNSFKFLFFFFHFLLYKQIYGKAMGSP